ncbi:Carbonic anhydrase [Mycena sanguinolenta]|uniref:Carbonic anhydrase n=1 Tax=Mycena sanguinolenta TaxID=230812 RepID=A0A8H6YU28_9AGAR|nr:Carbonic anhydrase [Mycena sanguinolenta]
MAPRTPRAQELLGGNASANPNYFPQLTAEKQHPKVLWIGCADSRVPETTICGCSLGDILAYSNLANQVAHTENDCGLSVIQYAVETLHVKDIVVVGHTSCDAVEAAWLSSKLPHDRRHPAEKPLQRWLAPLARLSIELGLNLYPMEEKHKAVRMLTEENARRQAHYISSLPIVQVGSRWAPLGVDVHAWVFEMETGKLIDITPRLGPRARL